MKIARLLPFIFLMLIYAPIVGQDVASLQAALNSAQGTERVDILQQLVETLKTQDPTQARKYAEEALDLSNKLQYKKGIIKSNFYLGIHARDNHNYRKAIRLVNEGLKMARDNKEFEVALQGLEILKTIYQVTNKTQKLAETERMIKQVSGRLKLKQTTEE